MKRVILSLAVVFLMLLQGCGGLSQDEYDKIVAEKNALNDEMETLKVENGEIQKELSDVKTKNEELENEKVEKVEAELKLAVPKAWATMHFGDDCIVLAENEEYLQIISKEEYAASEEGVQKMWNCFLKASEMLGTMLDKIVYDKIGIKFMQEGNKELAEMVFKRTNGTYALETISIDLENCVPLSAAFVSVSKNKNEKGANEGNAAEDEGDGQQEEDDKAEKEPAQEVSDLFQEVYLPYAKREKPFVFEGVKTFAQNTTVYTVEINEPDSADECSITFTDGNDDYVYIAFAPNEMGVYMIMTLAYHQASSGSEVSLSNYSSDGSAAYDKFTTQAAGESSKEVRGTSEQQAFLFPK